MRLRLCYLGVLTALCVLSVVMTVLGLASKQWISIRITTTEHSKMKLNGDNSPQNETTVVNLQLGMFTISTCTRIYEQHICMDIGHDSFNNILKFAAANATNASKSNDDEEATRVVTGAFFTMVTTLKALTIVGLIFQILGALFAVSFWRRSLELLANARWIASAVCWFVSGVFILGAVGLGFFINQEIKSLETASFTEDTRLDTKTAKMRMQTAWALLFSGFAVFLALVTGIVVLMAKRFRVAGHKYRPVSLISYTKGRDVDSAQDGELLLKPNGQEEEEENVRLDMHYVYHD